MVSATFNNMTTNDYRELSDWFEENALDFSRSIILAAPIQTLPHAWFNSETAQLKVETRAPEKQISCQTGDGDGDYLVWALLSQPVEPSQMYIADGAFIILDSAIHGTHKNLYNHLTLESVNLAPLLIGELQVFPAPSIREPNAHGFIFISDFAAEIDSEFFTVEVALKPGNYKVVAWVGEALLQPLSPRAIEIYGEYFADAIHADMQGRDWERKPFLEPALMAGDDGDVMTRMSNNMDSLADKNASISYDRSVLLSDSWAFQRFYEGSETFQESIMNLRDGKPFEIDELLMIADALRIRGKRSASSAVIQEILGKKEALSEEQQRLLLSTQSSLCGMWPSI